MFDHGFKRSALALAGTLAGVLAMPGLAHAASREINVTFHNDSDQALELAQQQLPHGCWGDTSPPQHIDVGATTAINSHSCGVATGTEFALDYRLTNSGQNLHMHYDNPFVGSNSYSDQAPQGYQVARTGGDGNEAHLDVHFGCNAATCDGIPDDWKRNGVTIDPAGPAGPQFVDLPKMGVELDRPNVFVHLDWMQDDPGKRDQRLRQTAIDRVIRAYDQAPRTYRGATRPGINLVVDEGPDSTIKPGGAKWNGLSRAGSIGFSEGLLTGWREPGYDLTNFYNLVRMRLAPAGRLPIFHYAVVPDHIVPSRKDKDGNTEWDNTSGYGVSYGFIVSLGGWTDKTGNEDEQAGTFMHELGHTLGLSHGGQDGGQYKPNFPSVMNYLYQSRGVPRGGSPVWDYSTIDTPDFDETQATEGGGVSLGAGGAGFGTGHRCPDGKGGFSSVVINVLAPVDWSCDKETTGKGFDVNGDGMQTLLKGSTSDWSRLQFQTGGIGAGTNAESQIPASGDTAPVHELTVEEDATIAGLDTDAPATTLHATPAANADGWNGGPVTLTFTVADGAGSGVSLTEVAIDGGAFAPVNGPIVLGDEGVRQVRFRSTDRAQNVEATQTAVIRIDRTKPATSATLDPQPNAAGWSNGPVTVRVAATDALSGVRTTAISSTGAVASPLRTLLGAAASLLVDRDGVTTVRHHATDRADNTSDDVLTTVRTDATPPSATIDVRDHGATTVKRGEFVTGTAQDATSGVDAVTVTYEPRFAAVNDNVTVQARLSCSSGRLRCTWQADRPPHPGPWQVTAVAVDVAGNRDPAPPSERVVITG
ncbi:MAG: hypothetical protein QOI73_1025 [Solirubrobacteraceae bacterium]|nr:hypothetical protein [Solirubrobacteraceae bacterium]